MKKISPIILKSFIVLFAAFMIIISLRGNTGNPTAKQLNESEWKENGPFELSPERGRFALTYSIVEDKSFQFSVDVARFATPDLGYKDGKYVSLFAPGLSFLIAPGYLIGKLFNAAQIGSFTVIGLFALINFVLINLIANKLGARAPASWLASFVFLSATPAFSYAVSLYQHHISTFLILMSIYILLKSRGLIALSIVWVLIAASIPVDYPNLILMLPIGIFALGRFLKTKVDNSKIKIKFYPLGVITMVTALIPLLFFVWFNTASYSNPLQLSGTVATVKNIGEDGLPQLNEAESPEEVDQLLKENASKKSALGFFSTRRLVDGLSILLASQDRGILYFTPVVFIALLGIFYLSRKNSIYAALFISIILLNILFYGMWGDPWGGWAFGSRYLIPSYALMSILIAIALTHLRKSILFNILFLILFSYSVSVNALGALTSNANPPQPEIVFLEEQTGIEQKSTYERNWDHLNNNRTKSIVYKSIAEKISLRDYWIVICALLTALSAILLVKLRITKNYEETI